MKKYEFTGEILEYKGRILKGIRRISDGLIGGWIEKEGNLSHYGDCFVFDDAMIYGNAKVYDNARVFGNAEIYDNAMIYDNAKVYGNTKVCGNAMIYGGAEIFGSAEIFGNTMIFGNARVYGNAEIFGTARVFDNAKVYDNARVYGNAEIYGRTVVVSSIIGGEVQIPYKKVEFYQGDNTRMITAIKKEDDTWIFNIGCQRLITKEEFINRIHNTDGGLERNPHREFYLKILSMF